MCTVDAGIIDTPPIKFGADPYPLGVAPDSGGNLYIADAQSCVILAFIPPSTTVTVAGNGSCGPPSGDGGIATDASINGTYKLAVDSRGNLYISDYQDGIIRKVDGITGIITTIAGQSGVHAHTDDGVPAISATLQRPQGLTVDGSGNLFFADQTDYTVRRIDASSGILTTVAGNFASGRGYSGDGGAATSAQLKFPNAVAVDSAGNLFISDEGNNVIRKVTASSGIITTVAGQGPPAAGGYGGDGGPATSALLMAPSGVVVDAAGNFYIADSKNALVRKVNAQSGIITSAAGIFTGSDEYTGDGGAATLAGLSRFKDVALDASGNIYLADTNNGVVREVAAASGIAAFGSFDVGISSAAIDVTLINNGNAALNLSALAPSTNFNLSGPDTTCTTSSVLTPSGSCILGIEFLPTVAGSLTGTLTLTDNTGNNSTSTQSVALSGTGLPANADKLAISGVSSTLSDGGNLGTIQVSVESNNGIVVTGSTASITVTITGPNGYLQQVTAAAVNGVATFNLSSLVFSTDGSYQVTATSNDLSQASAPFAVTGSLQPAKLFLPALPATVAVGENLGIVPVSVETSGGLVVTNSTASITVTITGPNGFSQQVTANAADGIATFDLSTLAFSTAGSYTITATSSGLTQASASFTVTASAAEAAKLALPTIPAVVAVGENLGIVPVSVETSSGSVVVTSTALVTITITFPDDSTQVFTTAAVSGIASFNMGTLKLSQPGSYLITATSTGLTLASAAFTVTSSAADAAKLALPTIPATVAVGDSLGAVPVSVETSTGSVVTSSTASVTATITGPNGYLQSVTATAVNGIAIFNLSSLTFSTAGSYTITATGVGLTPASASFIVTASASEPAKLALPAIPASVAVGENLGNIPVSVETNSGGVVTSSSAIVTITITGPNGYLQTIMATAANGIASFNLSNLTLTSAGSYTITASSIGLSPASVTFTVTASTAEQANLALSTIPAAVGQSTSLGTVQVSVETSGGAVVTDSTASITLTITGPNGYSQTLTVAAVNGVATFDTTAFAFSALGNYTVTASSTGLTSAVAAFIVEQDFSLTPSSGGTNPAPTQDVLPGAAAAYQLQLAPAGATFNAPITLSATGLPPGATYTFNPAVVTPGTAAATTTFTVDTAKTTASLRPRQNMIWGFAALLPAMFLVPWTSPQRRRKTRRFLMLPLLLGLLSLGIVGITGCGAGGLFGQPQTSYTITVTGTSGALTHSTTVTLIVQ
jgi:sugar lactone lactonase YvrE/23S rRNA pseudoU1915 N3-methylase RlmH